jgi:hypothetical protein
VSVQLVLLALIAASVLGSLAIVLANSSRIPRAAVGLPGMAAALGLWQSSSDARMP